MADRSDKFSASTADGGSVVCLQEVCKGETQQVTAVCNVDVVCMERSAVLLDVLLGVGGLHPVLQI